jgi:cell division protein FtsB
VRRRRFRLPTEITLPGPERHGDAIPKAEARRRLRGDGDGGDDGGGARERLRRRVIALLFGLVFLSGAMAALFGERGYVDVRRAGGEARQLEAEVGALRESVDDLRDEIRELKRDPAAVERLAREELGMARRDEVVFVLPDPEGRDLEPLSRDAR